MCEGGGLFIHSPLDSHTYIGAPSRNVPLPTLFTGKHPLPLMDNYGPEQREIQTENPINLSNDLSCSSLKGGTQKCFQEVEVPNLISAEVSIIRPMRGHVVVTKPGLYVFISRL